MNICIIHKYQAIKTLLHSDIINFRPDRGRGYVAHKAMQIFFFADNLTSLASIFNPWRPLLSAINGLSSSCAHRCDFVSLESTIAGDQRKPLKQRLGDEYPVEGIPMMRRESSGKMRMIGRHWQHFKCLLFQYITQGNRDFQFSAGVNDSYIQIVISCTQILP